MTQFPSFADGGSMLEALKLNPPVSRHLVAYHTALMRGDSPLSEAERELIAAFVSGLNACSYCHGVHAATARAFGVDAQLLQQLVDDPELEAAPPKLRPLLRYARKLTLEQTRMTAQDAQEVFAAGWDERALHDAICVAALFNFMNRFVHGHGLSLGDEEYAARGEGLMRNGYAPLAEALKD
jgi:uncharacterized peroxidase-related enzyme